MSRQCPDPPRRRFGSDQLFEESLPPFFELDRRDVLDRLVDEVLLVAAAARFVLPAPFFAEERVPADFVPPRADEVDFFEAERAPVLAPAFVPAREADLVVPLADDFDAPRAPAFDPDLVVDRAALFFAPPPRVDDLAAPLAPVDADFFAPPFFAPPFLAAPFFAPPVFAALFLADEVPRFAADLVPVLLPEDERFAPPLFAGLVVVEPPDISVAFV